MIKRIFSDMDGTLLNSKGRVVQTNADLIRKAEIPFTLVSARAPMEMRDAIEKLGLTGPQIAFNGGLIYEMNDGEIQPIQTETMESQTVKALLSAIRQSFPQVSLSYYGLNDWYCDRIDKGIRMEHELTQVWPTFVTDEEVFLNGHTDIFKIMLIVFDMEEMAELESYLRALSLPDITIQRSGQNYLEMTSLKAKKSRGIAYILDKENLSQADTAAFGDGHNDIPMLEMVGTAIVMENALDAVKAYGHHVTKSNDQNGVGYGIHTYLLNPIKEVENFL